MTYSRVSVPLQAQKTVPPADTVRSFPAVAVTASAKTEKKRLSFPYLLTACLLSLFSFVAGCAVTDSAVSKLLLTIGAASSGRIPARQQTSAYLAAPPAPEIGQPADVSVSDTLYRTLTAPASPSVSQTPTEPAAEPVSLAADSAACSDGEIWYPIAAKDLSCDDFTRLTNETSYTPDVAALAQDCPEILRDFPFETQEPVVLLLHTHATECYDTGEKADFYRPDAPTRTDDVSANVVAVGDKIAEVLNSFGITTVHDTTLCDGESFVRAYGVSSALVRQYKEKYPSLRLIIDLHRDAIESADGTRTKGVFSYGGETAAQLMFVVGTDAAGAAHPAWRDNLALAAYLQKSIAGKEPLLFRRINLRTASFNQQLSPGCLLLECGTCANTLQEAQNAARIFATRLADTLYDCQ